MAVPQVCFWMTVGTGKLSVRRKICLLRQTWPLVILEAWPKVPGPDPEPDLGPIASFSMDGINPEVAQDIGVLTDLRFATQFLSHEAKTVVREAIEKGLALTQKKLPEGVELAL
jgi:hypothetical protein